MICRRHGAIASHMEYGQPYCLRCFREAVLEADTVALERQFGLRPHTVPRSVNELIRRLEGRK